MRIDVKAMKKIAWRADEAVRLGRRVEHRRQLVHQRDHADGEPGEVPLAALRVAEEVRPAQQPGRRRPPGRGSARTRTRRVMPAPGPRRAASSVATPCGAQPATGRQAAHVAGRAGCSGGSPGARPRARAPRPGATERTSPVSPTSPHSTTSSGSGRPRTLDATAATTARSAAGSSTRRPPATFRNTSWSCSCMRRRFSSTASSSADAAGIDADRRSAAAWPARSATRAPGSRPARAGCPRASPARPSRARPRGARRGTPPTGSAPRRARAPPISKTPTSLVEPKRFFTARSTRSACAPSPSK